MYFIIIFKDNKWTSYTNEIFETEEKANDYIKRSKPRKNKYQAVEYNNENIDKYWYK